jgi:hypothetical protein
VASKSHRFAAPVAGFLLAASLSGCAASQTVDSAMSSVSAISLAPEPPMWAGLVGR